MATNLKTIPPGDPTMPDIASLVQEAATAGAREAVREIGKLGREAFLVEDEEPEPKPSTERVAVGRDPRARLAAYAALALILAGYTSHRLGEGDFEAGQRANAEAIQSLVIGQQANTDAILLLVDTLNEKDVIDARASKQVERKAEHR